LLKKQGVEAFYPKYSLDIEVVHSVIEKHHPEVLAG
jgi:hypothetical protein